MRTEQLYVVTESPDGPVKIGRSKKASKRIAGLQTGNPRPLAIVGIWELSTRNIAQAEKWLIEELYMGRSADDRLVGEWVPCTPRLIIDFMGDFLASCGWPERRVA